MLFWKVFWRFEAALAAAGRGGGAVRFLRLVVHRALGGV